MSYEAEIALQVADDRVLYERATEHIATCDKPIPQCRICSDEFGLRPGRD